MHQVTGLFWAAFCLIIAFKGSPLLAVLLFFIVPITAGVIFVIIMLVLSILALKEG